MKNTSIDISSIEIDLSFNIVIPKSSIEIPYEAETMIWDKEIFWNIQLKSWLNLIRANETFDILPLIREKNFFSIGLEFIDDLSIAKINSEWLGKNESTDVLSFSALDEYITLPENKCIELGDIIVSIPTAQKQAKIHNHCLTEELRWLVSHGFLHLLGWDHPTTKRLNQMLSFQEQLLNMEGNLSDELQTVEKR